jgi:hypothetical protein
MSFSPDVVAALKRDHAIPAGALGSLSAALRKAAMTEAILWPKGASMAAQVFTPVYAAAGYEVGVRKPGKEAEPGYSKPNVNDMLPCVRSGGVDIQLVPSFEQIFGQFEMVFQRSPEAAELLGALLFRQAFMLDYVLTGSRVRHSFKPSFIEFEREIPEMGGIPSRVYLWLLEMLALNEDVKYTTLGYDLAKKPVGRKNTLLTCAHFVAVLIGRVKMSTFAGALTRANVAPLSQENGRAYFRFLSV